MAVVDAGDIVPTPASPAISFRTIEEDLRQLLEGTRTPILLGGDHSILIPAMKALVAKHGPLNLVCFDSHADIGTTTDPNVHTHGVTLRRLLEANRTSRVFHIGMRGFGPPPRALEWMRLKAVSWWKMQEIDDIGLDTVLSSITAQCRGKSYITLDIDVLDPAFAPGTGTPEPGGLTTRELLRAIRCLSSELDVVGFDVVEVSPPYDISEITAAAANRSIMEFLGGAAARKVEQWSDTGPEEVKTPNQP